MEGLELTAPSSPATAHHESRPKSKKKEAEIIEILRCLASNGRVHMLTSCTVFTSLTPAKRARKYSNPGGVNYASPASTYAGNVTDTFSVGGCTGSRHHTLLHGSKFIPLRKLANPQALSAPPSTAFLGTVTHLKTVKRRARLKILLVCIKVGEK